jgi:hypothetical protein
MKSLNPELCLSLVPSMQCNFFQCYLKSFAQISHHLTERETTEPKKLEKACSSYFTAQWLIHAYLDATPPQAY